MMQPPTYSYVLIVLGVASICVLTKSGARIERYWKGDVANFDTQAIKQVRRKHDLARLLLLHTHTQTVAAGAVRPLRVAPPQSICQAFVKQAMDRVACCRARQVRTRATRPKTDRTHARSMPHPKATRDLMHRVQTVHLETFTCHNEDAGIQARNHLCHTCATDYQHATLN